MTSELKIGDVVMLRGGGPLMVVKEVIAPEGDIFWVWLTVLRDMVPASGQRTFHLWTDLTTQ